MESAALIEVRRVQIPSKTLKAARSENRPSVSKHFEPLPERWRDKLCSSFADLTAHEEAVNLISLGCFEGSEVLFADARQHLTASCESVRELIVGYNWFAAQNGKEKIDIEKNGVGAPGRVEELLNQWVRLSRGKALVLTGKLFEGRDEILSLLQAQK